MVGKGLRFDVFRRDSFTCRYCGRKPPEAILEVDHLVPRAKGGQDMETNLVTACWECNRGKSDKLLSDPPPRGDDDAARLEIEQLRLEHESYLGASRLLECTRAKTVERLQNIWGESFGGELVPTEKIVIGWLQWSDPMVIENAIRAAIPAYLRGDISDHTDWKFNGMLRYVSGIIKRMNSEEGS